MKKLNNIGIEFIPTQSMIDKFDYYINRLSIAIKPTYYGTWKVYASEKQLEDFMAEENLQMSDITILEE